MPLREGLPYPCVLLCFALVRSPRGSVFPTCFSRLRQIDAAHPFHGITATSWLPLLIGRSWLARTRRLVPRRTSGRCSLLAAPPLIASELLMVHALPGSAEPFNRTCGARLAFIDLAQHAEGAPQAALSPDSTATRSRRGAHRREP